MASGGLEKQTPCQQKNINYQSRMAHLQPLEEKKNAS
jgi:hypothetical protein